MLAAGYAEGERGEEAPSSYVLGDRRKFVLLFPPGDRETDEDLMWKGIYSVAMVHVTQKME